MKTKHYFWGVLTLCAGLSLTACDDDDNGVGGVKQLADDEPAAAVQSTGFYLVNEDWFGHDNGSVNFFKQTAADSYEGVYRAYRAANGENETLGVTTQYGTVWGGNVYFISKQGNRLVVADAETLKKKAVLTDIQGDGRSFVGVDEKKGYIALSDGIVVFDIESMAVGNKIEGVSGQIGNMALSGNRVFAVSQQNGLYVINAETDAVEKNISGTFNTLTVSKDGKVWVAGSEGFECIDPLTLESRKVAYPEGTAIGNSWGAWNAGGLCASTQENVLYWTAGGSMFGGGKLVVKYDIDKAAAAVIYELGKSDNGVQLEFYGAGLRVDPLTDHLILTAKHEGWGGAYAWNWLFKLTNAGKEVTHFLLQGDNGTGEAWSGGAEDWNGKYFWFPAMPMFQDANKPQLLLNQVWLKPGETAEVNLAEKVVDYDNAPAAMRYFLQTGDAALAEVSLQGSVLKVQASEQTGTTKCRIGVLSNGVRVEKDIEIAVMP